MSFTEDELLRMLGERVDSLKLQVREYDLQGRRFYDAHGKANAAIGRVRRLHFAYRGVSDFDSCAHCNRLANGEIAWPCPTIKALDDVPWTSSTATTKNHPQASLRATQTAQPAASASGPSPTPYQSPTG